MNETLNTARDEATRQAQRVLEVSIAALVDLPEAVEVAPLSSTQSVIFEVKVSPEDVRRIIGRKGRTANAVREILMNIGAKVGMRFHLEIVEPVGRVTLALGV